MIGSRCSLRRSCRAGEGSERFDFSGRMNREVRNLSVVDLNVRKRGLFSLQRLVKSTLRWADSFKFSVAIKEGAGIVTLVPYKRIILLWRRMAGSGV